MAFSIFWWSIGDENLLLSIAFNMVNWFMNKVEALLEEYRDKLNRHKLPGIAVIWEDALTANRCDSGFVVYITNILNCNIKLNTSP